MNYFISIIFNILGGIIGGIIAGFIVYFILDCKEKKQWQKSKTRLVGLFDDVLTRALTTIRLLAGIEPPLGIKNNEDFLDYIKKEFGEDYQQLIVKVKNSLNPERYNTLLKNIKGLNEEVRYLLLAFLSFKKAESWYIENILDLYNQINSKFWIFYTFPEISDLKYQNDNKIKSLKNNAVNDLVDFCKFVLVVKQSKNIKK